MCVAVWGRRGLYERLPSLTRIFFEPVSWDLGPSSPLPILPQPFKRHTSPRPDTQSSAIENGESQDGDTARTNRAARPRSIFLKTASSWASQQDSQLACVFDSLPAPGSLGSLLSRATPLVSIPSRPSCSTPDAACKNRRRRRSVRLHARGHP